MKADPTTTEGVSKTLTAMAEAYRQRDLKALTAHFLPDADATLVGTGVDEIRVGISEIAKQAERDWDQTDAASMRLAPRHVSASGNVAWVTAEGEFHVTAGGRQLRMPIRVTSVLERRDGRWLVAQAHFSAPADGQDEGRSFPAE